ncbi:unnamed protein product [Arabidopsis halleri]
MAATKKPTLQDVVSDDLNYERWAPIVKANLTEKGLWDVVENGVPPNPSKIPDLATKIQPEDLSKWRDFVGNDTKALQILQSYLPESVFRLTLETASAKDLWDLLKEANEQAKKKNEALPEYQMLAFNVGPVTFDKDMWMIYTRMGDIRIMTKEGKMKTIKNVLFVPKIDRNVLSVGQMAQAGLWDVVANEIPPDPSKIPELAAKIQAEELCNWRELAREDMKALQILQSSLTDSVFRMTLSAASAKDIWDLLNQVPDHVVECFDDDNSPVYENVWKISSTNSNHITSYEKFFTTLDRSRKAMVRFTNGDTTMAEGIGDVTIMTQEGKKTIKNVLYVPGVVGNALSVSQMLRSGFEVRMDRERCTIWDRTARNYFGETMLGERGFCLRLDVIEGHFRSKKRKFTQV